MRLYIYDQGTFKYCCCSVANLCLTLYETLDCNMPDVPVLHYLPEFVQTHVCCVDDAIKPSHPLSPPSPLYTSIKMYLKSDVLFLSNRTFSDFYNFFNLPPIQNTPNNRYPSVQFSSVTQSCPTVCDPMNRSTLGLPVHH